MRIAVVGDWRPNDVTEGGSLSQYDVFKSILSGYQSDMGCLVSLHRRGVEVDAVAWAKREGIDVVVRSLDGSNSDGYISWLRNRKLDLIIAFPGGTLTQGILNSLRAVEQHEYSRDGKAKVRPVIERRMAKAQPALQMNTLTTTTVIPVEAKPGDLIWLTSTGTVTPVNPKDGSLPAGWLTSVGLTGHCTIAPTSGLSDVQATLDI